VLKLANITVSISAVTILRNLSLSVGKGEIAGLVGRNGAGKTTTLRSIMGLAKLKEGGISLGETDLTALGAHERARLGIGYLPEDRRLVGPLSVRNNLLVPAQINGHSGAEARLKKVFDLLPELEPLAERKAITLSGGQQKLVALARSFVNGKKLLLLDEPFEGVSTALSRRLAQAVRDFQDSEKGVSVLVAESDHKRAAMLTSSAFVIERGEVIEEAKL
jgi:branched-chain amino acid transport system ATP-binding protein